MAGYSPSSEFQAAAAYLSNASSLSKVSNAIKLELYGLFKYLSTSHSPTTSRPSIFDITGRAKWDAWKQAEKSYGDRDIDAEGRYVQLARELGWTEDTPDIQDHSGERARGDASEENIWDDESSKRGGGGMGNSVSTVAQEDEEEREEGTLHNVAVTGHVEELQAFLQAHPTTNLNELDEYGYTALHLACDRGHLPIVKLLLSKDIDLNIKDPDDFTAVELARIAEHDDIVAMLETASS